MLQQLEAIYSNDAEQAVIGAILLTPACIAETSAILRGDPLEIFHNPQYAKIYSAMLHLKERGMPIDALTVNERLKATESDDNWSLSCIADATGNVPTSANVERYAQIVFDKYCLRRLVQTCNSTISDALRNPEDVSMVLDKAEKEVYSITRIGSGRELGHVNTVAANILKELEARIEKGDPGSGVTTNIAELDRLTNGFYPSDMIVLAARPSVGKTAIALNITKNVAVVQKKGVLFFSLEMSRAQLVNRMLAMVADVDMTNIRNAELDNEELERLRAAAGRISDCPLYIDDTPGISAFEIRSRARRHMARHQTSLIVVDYLQLMSGNGRGGTREAEVAEISRGIKALAKELNVPVIALSQLSRDVERTTDNTPRLSHLRESGAIEQDADVVLLMWTRDNQPSAGESVMVNLSVAKQRNGPVGNIQLRFIGSRQTFINPQVYDSVSNEEYGSGPNVAPETLGRAAVMLDRQDVPRSERCITTPGQVRPLNPRTVAIEEYAGVDLSRGGRSSNRRLSAMPELFEIFSEVISPEEAINNDDIMRCAELICTGSTIDSGRNSGHAGFTWSYDPVTMTIQIRRRRRSVRVELRTFERAYHEERSRQALEEMPF